MDDLGFLPRIFFCGRRENGAVFWSTLFMDKEQAFLALTLHALQGELLAIRERCMQAGDVAIKGRFDFWRRALTRLSGPLNHEEKDESDILSSQPRQPILQCLTACRTRFQHFYPDHAFQLPWIKKLLQFLVCHNHAKDA